MAHLPLLTPLRHRAEPRGVSTRPFCFTSCTEVARRVYYIIALPLLLALFILPGEVYSEGIGVIKILRIGHNSRMR